MGRKSLIAVSLCILAIVFPTIVVSAASVTLQNGDVIIGNINQEKVTFQAKVGKVEIKADEIVSFEDGKLQLKDGTTIVGTFRKGSLDISTNWGGTVSVKAQDITRITQATQETFPIETSKVEQKLDKISQPINPVSPPYAPPPPTPILVPYTPPPPTPLKKTIAVATFENRASKASVASGGIDTIHRKTGGTLSAAEDVFDPITRGLADQLTDALVQSGRFKVLDRQIIESVVAEQDFGASARTTKEGGAAVGGIYRAQILVKGAVTEFDPGTAASGQAFNIYGVTLGSVRAEAHVAVIIYLVDTTTSQVIDSQRVEGKAESGGTVWGVQGGQFGFGQAEFKETPLGKATQIVIDRAVDYVSKRLAREQWQGMVAKVEGNTAFINAGSRSGVMRAQEFIACKGSGVIDPVTGVSLGHSLKPIGLLRISNAYPDFAEAQLADGSMPERNDFVVPRGVTGVSPYERPGAGELQK